jgi:hypothetical protein
VTLEHRAQPQPLCGSAQRQHDHTTPPVPAPAGRGSRDDSTGHKGLQCAACGQCETAAEPMSRAPGSALSHRRWGTAPSSLFPAPRPHQPLSTSQPPASRYIPGRYKDADRPYPHLPPTLRSANRTQYSPLARRGAKRGGEAGRVRASETRRTPATAKCPVGAASNTTVVPSAYRMSIPHGGCDTVLWSQLLERNTPMFANRPSADHLAFQFQGCGIN